MSRAYQDYLADVDDYYTAIAGALEDREGHRAPPMPAMTVLRMFEQGLKPDRAAAILASPDRRPAA